MGKRLAVNNPMHRAERSNSGGRRTATGIQALAKLYGVQTAYRDAFGRRVVASIESLTAVLRALGAPVETPADVRDAASERRLAHWRRLVEPVTVVWLPRGRATVDVRLPSAQMASRLDCTLELENGGQRSWTARASDLPITATADIEGERFVAVSFSLPTDLPMGYHTLHVQGGGPPHMCRVIVAPAQAYEPDGDPAMRRMWGAFMPLYALYSRDGWPSGDLADLERLMEWTSALGGRVVATLPLLASFLGDTPFEPSPYSPASRLFWNEFYIHIESLPELSGSPRARDALASPAFQKTPADLRAQPLVDYRRQMALKRSVLKELAHTAFASGETPALRRFLALRPDAVDYSRFRAVTEREDAPWRAWPERQRNGDIQPGDYEEDAYRYHLYVQWRMEEQLAAVADRATARGETIYLDLPVGVHADSYDAWRERTSFISGVSAGAPPDDFFTRGQDWGFPPLHPERSREDGHRYWAAVIRHHLRHAGMLRIDHVMGLHRLYILPHGLEATQGAYIRYPANEFYAVLCIESHRERAMIVGENLGTVPAYVNETMRRRNVHGMYVGQFHLRSDRGTLTLPSSGVVASLNTHDTPTFAAHWSGLDIADRVSLGALTPGEAKKEEMRRHRSTESLTAGLRRRKLLATDAQRPAVGDVLRAALTALGRSGAQVVLASLEDLWGETSPQNTPGTHRERPNWRRRARLSLEEITATSDVRRALDMLDEARRAAETTAKGVTSA